MNTQEIIAELNSMIINDVEDYDAVEKINMLMDELEKNNDSHLACGAMISLLERNPEFEFGTPGEPVHTLEDHPGHYEEFLYQSLNRKPTDMTVWMLNRIINAEENEGAKKEQLKLMRKCASNPQADKLAKSSARNYIKYQKQKQMK